MTGRGLTLCLRLGAAISFLSGVVQAAETTPYRTQLEMNRGPGTEGCASQSSLKRDIEARLGRKSFAERGAELKLRVDLSHSEEHGYEAELVLRDATGNELGRRRLRNQDENCDELSRALGLVMELSINRLRDAHVQAEEERARDREAQQLRFDGLVTAAIEGGVLPGIAVLPRVEFGVIWPTGWRVAARLSTSLNAVESDSDFARHDAAVLLCTPDALTGRTALFICGGVMGGISQAEGRGWDPNASARRPALGAGVSGRLRYPSEGKIFGQFGLELELPVIRDDFVALAGTDVNGREISVFRASVVGALGGIGVGIRF